MATKERPQQKQPRPDLSELRAPHLGLLALELRAPWEFGALLPAWPILSRAPQGDGHTVIVFPGLSANDSTTIPLRRYIASLGYEVQGWNQGFNLGPRAGVLESAREQLKLAASNSGKTVSLIGWSLGGVYARELAKELAELTRCVITLGTPFGGPPRSTNAWRIYEMASGRSIDRETAQYDLPEAPPVPTTSVYSRSDGVVAWKGSVQHPSASNTQTENVEVVASHFGIGLNPSAWWAVADRLAQKPGQWQPFRESLQKSRVPGLKTLVYPDPLR